MYIFLTDVTRYIVEQCFVLLLEKKLHPITYFQRAPPLSAADFKKTQDRGFLVRDIITTAENCLTKNGDKRHERSC